MIPCGPHHPCPAPLLLPAPKTTGLGIEGRVRGRDSAASAATLP